MSQTAIGQPIPRVDARAKVTGSARYAADFAEAGVLHAALVTSPAAKGRLTTLDTRAAAQMPGVALVMTHREFREMELGEDAHMFQGGHSQSSFNPLSGDEIRYHGQIIALVVADTIEAAEHAAASVRATIAEEPAEAALEQTFARRQAMPETPMGGGELKVGDAAAALAAAPVRIEAEYSTAPQHHNPIELYATTAAWHDGKLTVYTPSQWVIGQRAGLATVFGLPAEDVQVLSPYIGGGFGSKASLLPHTVLVAAAAKRLRRPVKLMVPREAMFTVGSFRAETRHTIGLGADRDGKLLAFTHEATSAGDRTDRFALPCVEVTARMYAFPAIHGQDYVAEVDTNTPGFMRAPAEAPSFFALESAMDELAHALRMDPVALRLKNEPERDPITGKPWSSRKLAECYRRGAGLFGWDRRDHTPGAMRDADGMLLGWGCATATYPVFLMPASAQVRIGGDGRVRVLTAAHDLGTGAYTVLAQIAADAVGVPADRVTVQLGDSDLPASSVAGGSVTTASTGSAIHQAATAARTKLIEAAVAPGGPFAGADPGAVTIAGGKLVGPGGAETSFAEALANSPAGAEAVAQWGPQGMAAAQIRAGLTGGVAQAGPDLGSHIGFSFGAHFVELRVNPTTRIARVARMVGVFDVGRVINPRTARSQLIGGMIWGASHGLMEATEIDRKRARFANPDLGGYHFATNADVPAVTVEMLDGHDPIANPLGVKGVGELGIVGVNAAVANAVFHATGVRVRHSPVVVDALLGA